MKYILILLALSGCYKQPASERATTAQVVCRDGVEYLYFSNSYGGSATVHLKTDGKPYTC